MPALLAVAGACGGPNADAPCKTGDLDCACFENDTCNDGLVYSGASSTYVAGVVARFADDKNYYGTMIWGSGLVGIRSRVEGAGSDGADGGMTPLIAGQWYTIGIQIMGSTIQALLNGEVVGTVLSEKLTSGTVGLATYGMQARFDDVEVTSLD